ncbi:hypothetical protein GUITHDRAFT_118870 [Guillardia theta CCMP2712]|uniref:Uncharacterized protein n=1 Tax=Guillardia theta (strain CCMP2712) TaxID=905079 RepID=L1IFA4_GUITC|nr:hypothetical protein GUITHDRAFT_118870 [Guillardia theta CCMP2712]EKX34936.1 hypothetical protein GUITHDRAFT_118870 [Guillardia theta CCMP2712]|eukprot:XP_005821916.1 hypothetical protein GUITHDRAFT_118870 [Guillardia theta CCMP2712]
MALKIRVNPGFEFSTSRERTAGQFHHSEQADRFYGPLYKQQTTTWYPAWVDCYNVSGIAKSQLQVKTGWDVPTVESVISSIQSRYVQKPDLSILNKEAIWADAPRPTGMSNWSNTTQCVGTHGDVTVCLGGVCNVKMASVLVHTIAMVLSNKAEVFCASNYDEALAKCPLRSANQSILIEVRNNMWQCKSDCVRANSSTSASRTSGTALSIRGSKAQGYTHKDALRLLWISPDVVSKNFMNAGDRYSYETLTLYNLNSYKSQAITMRQQPLSSCINQPVSITDCLPYSNRETLKQCLSHYERLSAFVAESGESVLTRLSADQVLSPYTAHWVDSERPERDRYIDWVLGDGRCQEASQSDAVCYLTVTGRFCEIAEPMAGRGVQFLRGVRHHARARRAHHRHHGHMQERRPLREHCGAKFHSRAPDLGLLKQGLMDIGGGLYVMELRILGDNVIYNLLPKCMPLDYPKMASTDPSLAGVDPCAGRSMDWLRTYDIDSRSDFSLNSQELAPPRATASLTGPSPAAMMFSEASNMGRDAGNGMSHPMQLFGQEVPDLSDPMTKGILRDGTDRGSAAHHEVLPCARRPTSLVFYPQMDGNFRRRFSQCQKTPTMEKFTDRPSAQTFTAAIVPVCGNSASCGLLSGKKNTHSWKVDTFLTGYLRDVASLFNSPLSARSVIPPMPDGVNDNEFWLRKWVYCTETQRNLTTGEQTGEYNRECFGSISKQNWLDPAQRFPSCKAVTSDAPNKGIMMNNLCIRVADFIQGIQAANCNAAGVYIDQRFLYNPAVYSISNQALVTQTVLDFFLVTQTVLDFFLVTQTVLDFFLVTQTVLDFYQSFNTQACSASYTANETPSKCAATFLVPIKDLFNNLRPVVENHDLAKGTRPVAVGQRTDARSGAALCRASLVVIGVTHSTVQRTVTGKGCFDPALPQEKDIAIATHKGVLRMKQGSVAGKVGDYTAYGGQCTPRYEAACPGSSNSFASCEPLCSWLEAVAKGLATDKGCSCDQECTKLSTTPLYRLTSGAVDIIRDGGSISQVAISTVLDQSKIRQQDLAALVEEVAAAAGVDKSRVNVVGTGSVALCKNVEVSGHPTSTCNGVYSTPDTYNGKPHYANAEGANLYFDTTWCMGRGGTWNFGVGTFPPLSGALTSADYFDASITDLAVPTGTHILGKSRKQILISCTSKSPSCPCTGQTWASQTLLSLGVQTNYGSYCAAWEDGDCASHACGEKKTCVQMWPESAPGTWCCEAWCYVDPNTCKLQDVTLSVVGILAAGNQTGVQPLSYSYQTCLDTPTKYTSSTCPWTNKASFSIEEAPYTMILDDNYCNIVDKVAFENQVLQDLSTALGVDKSFFQILSYSPGSIVIEMKVVNGVKLLQLGKSAGGLVAELTRQTLDAGSLLKKGVYTQYATTKTNDNFVQSVCTSPGNKLDSLKQALTRRVKGCRNESCWVMSSSYPRAVTSVTITFLLTFATLWALEG